MKKIFKLMFLITIIFVVSLTILWFRGVKERNDALSVTINEIDLSTLEDGRYYGYYDGGIHGYRENSVEVTIRNNEIVDIKNTLNNEKKSDEFLEELYQRVIEHQSLEIDAISTATLTTKAYLKAIENALENESN